MPINTTCPNCKARFRLADELAGKKVRCQKCSGIFEVPAFDGSMGSPNVPTSSSEASAQEQAAPLATVALPPLPVAASAPPTEVEYDDRPRQDDKDEEPPPISNKSGARRPPRLDRREPAKSGSIMLPVILAFLGLAVLSCVICGGAGIGWYFVNDKQKDAFAQGKKDLPAKKDGVAKKGFPLDIFPPQVPVNPIKVNFGPDGNFRQDTQLTQFDPINPRGTRHKRYAVRMEANRTYQIDMMSNQMDSFLIVSDENNIEVAADDDGGGDLNARIIFPAPRAGVFHIQATHCPAGENPGFPSTGNFTLTIQRR